MSSLAYRAYKMFCTQNLEEVVRDHDNKGYINFAVDFDGVLCKSAHPKIGEPNIAMIQYLIDQKKKGNKIILWTARTDIELQEAVNWSREHGLEFDYVNEGDPVVEKMYGKPGCPTRKVYADVYIDDRNMAPLNIWPVQCYSEEEGIISGIISYERDEEDAPDEDAAYSYLAEVQNEFLLLKRHVEKIEDILDKAEGAEVF